jgi:hypothetical protein
VAKSNLGEPVDRVVRPEVARASQLILVSRDPDNLDNTSPQQQDIEAHCQRVGNAVWPGCLAAHAVAKACLLLDDEDAEAGSGQDPAEGRTGNASTDDDDVEEWRGHARSPTWRTARHEC